MPKNGYKKKKDIHTKTNRCNQELTVKIVTTILLIATLLGTILPSIITVANAASSKEIQEQIDNIEKEQQNLHDKIDELEQQKIDNVAEIQEMIEQKAILDQQAGTLDEEIRLVNEKISAQAILIADKQDELDIANDNLEARRAENIVRIRAMEENGSISYWSVLFKATSFANLLDRMAMVKEIADADQRKIAELNNAAKEVETAKSLLESEKAEMDASRAELAILEQELETKREEAGQILHELVARGEEFNEYIFQAQEGLRELEEELLAAEKAYDEAKKAEYLAYINDLKNNPNAKVDKNGRAWVVPCYYMALTSPFGYRIHPVYKQWAMHNGVDLASDCPTPIYATRGGIVTVSGWDARAGYYVKIDHLDGYSSVYMHFCKMPYVKVGDVVMIGQKIGCMGTTGTSTGVHLHFGIQYNGSYVDPMRYIG